MANTSDIKNWALAAAAGVAAWLCIRKKQDVAGIGDLITWNKRNLDNFFDRNMWGDSVIVYRAYRDERGYVPVGFRYSGDNYNAAMCLVSPNNTDYLNELCNIYKCTLKTVDDFPGYIPGIKKIGKVEYSDFYEATIISEDGKFKVVFSVIHGSGTIRAEIYQRTTTYIDPNNYDPNTMVEWFKWKTIYDGSLKGAFRKARSFIVNSGSYISPKDFENL